MPPCLAFCPEVVTQAQHQELGGLVDLGKPENLGRLGQMAQKAARDASKEAPPRKIGRDCKISRKNLAQREKNTRR